MATTTAPATQTDGIAALMSSLSSVVTQAQAVLDTAASSRTQQAAARQIVALASATMLQLQAQLTPTQTPSTYTVQQGDTLLLIAQQQLGDPLQYVALQQVNGLHGPAIAPGRVLTLPVVS